MNIDMQILKSHQLVNYMELSLPALVVVKVTQALVFMYQPTMEPTGRILPLRTFQLLIIVLKLV